MTPDFERYSAIWGVAVCLLCTTLAIGAPKPPPTNRSSADSTLNEARAVLEKAAKFHRDADDISILFQAEVYTAATDRKESFKGRLLLKGEDKFYLEIPGSKFISDGQILWEYHEKNKQVMIKPALSEKDNMVPGKVLFRFLESDPLSLEKVEEKGKPLWKLTLNPSGVMKSLQNLVVYLDRSSHAARKIHSIDYSGNETIYSLLEFKKNAGVRDGQFKFTVPKGVDVVDMRE